MFNKLHTNEERSLCATVGPQQITVVPLRTDCTSALPVIGYYATFIWTIIPIWDMILDLFEKESTLKRDDQNQAPIS